MGLNTPISGILIKKTRFLTHPALKLRPYLDLGVVEPERERFWHACGQLPLLASGDVPAELKQRAVSNSGLFHLCQNSSFGNS